MKAKYFLIGFIILTLSVFCSTFTTRAADYSLGVSENDEIIWEVTIVNEEGLEDLFQPVDLEEGGRSWRQNLGTDKNEDQVGSQWKIKVDWINESDDYVIEDKEEGENIEVDVWTVFYDDWYAVDADNDFNPTPDGDEYHEEVFKDPDDFNILTYNSDPDVEDSGATADWLEIFVPTPVADYLDEIKWQDDDWIPILYQYEDQLDPLSSRYDSELDEDDLTWDWSVDGTIITNELSFIWDDDPETTSWEGDTEVEDYIRVWTFDENTGVRSIFQIMNDDEEILYEYRTVSAIPGYELPILLGITAASVIGIIFIIRKKK